MSKRIIWIVVAVMLLVPGLGLADRTPVEADDQDEVAKKLDEVLINQEKILKELAAIKQELGRIRIRTN